MMGIVSKETAQMIVATINRIENAEKALSQRAPSGHAELSVPSSTYDMGQQHRITVVLSQDECTTAIRAHIIRLRDDLADLSAKAAREAGEDGK